MSTPAILYDLTKCVGCHFCELSCQMNKELPPNTSLQSFHYAEQASANSVKRAVRRHQCMHCNDPACVSACPVGALQKSSAGPVIYLDERCIGCRYCMNACPFGVPTFDWDSGLVDKALIHKCNLCADRLNEGMLPVCVENCPTGAVTFGHRDTLLAEGRARMEQHPDRYVNHIYGEHEVGGTSLLILSHMEFETLGLPALGSDSLTSVSETVMAGTIPFALAWTAVLGGVAALVRLRNRGTDTGARGKEDVQ